MFKALINQAITKTHIIIKTKLQLINTHERFKLAHVI